MKKLHECGDTNQMPGFGGNLSQRDDLTPINNNENPDFGKIQFVPVTFETQEELKEFIREIIRKVGSHYELKSHSGKNLGHFPTKSAAKKHELEINYFINKGK